MILDMEKKKECWYLASTVSAFVLLLVFV